MFDLKAIQAYTDFVARRARNAGYLAFQTGQERRAPVKVGEYAGDWVAGWNAAALDALDAPTAALTA
jgi:crotonobetainyl-CoA:carnitine CoA-transferase CaiB-like acyl-CoA transferase